MGALRILAVGVGVIVVSAIPGFLPGSLAPRIARDFAFGSAELGVVVAAFYAVAALGSVPAGNLVDRIGASASLRITCAAAAATMLGAALLGRSTTSLALIVGLSGAGNALCTPGSAALIATSLRARWRGLGYGAAQGGASWGSLLAGLALPGIAIPLGWRWVFVSAGVLAVVVGLAVPGGVSRPVAEHEAAPAVGQPGSRPSAAARLGPANYLMALAAALAATASVSMVSFLVLYALRVGLDERQAGLLLALIGFTGAVGRPCAGLLGGQRGRGKPRAYGVFPSPQVASERSCSRRRILSSAWAPRRSSTAPTRASTRATPPTTESKAAKLSVPVASTWRAVAAAGESQGSVITTTAAPRSAASRQPRMVSRW